MSDPATQMNERLCEQGREPFAVLLGDDLIDERDELLSTMLELQERVGGSVIALLEVPPELASLPALDLASRVARLYALLYGDEPSTAATP